MASSVGVMLDKNYIAAVKLEGNVKNPTIADFQCEIIPEQKEGEQTDPYTFRAKLLDEFLRKHHLPRLNLYIAISNEYCMLRQFTVPFQSEDQIRKTVRFEAESHIHTALIEDLEIQYKKIAEFKNRSEILIFAIRREALKETIKALKKYQIEPIGIDAPTAAITNHFLNQLETSEDAELWLNIGVEYTTFVIFKDGAIKYIREMKMGVPLPTKFAAFNSEKEQVKAVASAKLSESNIPEPKIVNPQGEIQQLKDIEAKVNPAKVAAKLALEIRRTFIALPTLDVKKIKVIGAGAMLEDVVEKLSKEYNTREVTAFKAPYSYKLKPDIEENVALAEHAIAAALGMALKGFNINNLGIEFRKGEFALKDAFEILKVPLAVAVVLLMLLFLSIFVYVYINKKALDKLEADLYQQMETIFSKDAYYVNGKHIKQMPKPDEKGGYAKAIKDAYVIIENDYFQAINQGSYKGLPKVRSVLDVWKKIFADMTRVGR